MAAVAMASEGNEHQAKLRAQYAALPFRKTDGLEIMLISSRDTGRWVLPKGWPIKGAKPHAVAAVEALEEAGLMGKIAKKPVGAYRYLKRQRNGAALLCEVKVFPFHVGKQRRKWPERGQRTTKWFSPDEAARLVHEPELQSIILSFAGAPLAKPGDVASVTAGRVSS